jgi:hypothetical protein
MITQSALSHGIATFAQQSKFTIAHFVASGATPEQASSALEVATGKRVSAGVIESLMVIYMRQTGARRPATNTIDDTVSDFKSDPIGRWHTAQTGVAGVGMTELYRLIAQRV